MAWKDINQEVDEKTSKINAAGLINITLENLWRDCYSAMARGNYKLWMIRLDSIWTILGGDEKIGSNADKFINEIDLKIYELGKLNSVSPMTFEKITNKNSVTQYQFLKRKSLYLRRLQNQQGKGTSYLSDDDYGFD